MDIRFATASDISRISEVIRCSYKTVALRYGLTPENCPKHPSNCTDQWIEKDFARGVQYYAYEKDHTVVGCAAMERANNERCYLERLAVLPDYRRRGIGLELFNHIVQEAKTSGLRAIGIGIIAKQDDLKNWYHAIGFRETGVKSFNHLPFDVAFMEYEIRSPA